MDKERIANAVQEVLRELAKEKDFGDASAGKKNRMTLKMAGELIASVEQEAARRGVSIVVAVSDEAARPVAIHCMDDAYIASFDIALHKAFTSAGLKMSTRELGELSQPGQPLYGIQYTNQGKIVIFGGGEPLCRDGDIVGALGVSGASAAEDTELAAYGKKIFEEVIGCQ